MIMKQVTGRKTTQVNIYQLF